ncbi:MAG: GGDEF domain-containing protein [Candidatus Melainabacteria bacterium]|jgi:diguanylate cyclase (GGDEF)-like protein|nr:GGDEF domain-containing protein [Candidatus Melainabacteria bacterium]
MAKGKSSDNKDKTGSKQGGWAQARDSKFTDMLVEMRVSRQKFKETKQQEMLDKSRETLSDERLDEIEKMTLIDSLTELYNPRTFLKKLEYELRRAKRYKRPLSLLIMSVDKLDELGRLHGQLFIDDTLRAAANIIRGAIRDVDVPARCNNNQLGVVFPETYSSRAIVVGERIREKIKGVPINDEIRHVRVTASIGVVSFPTHARNEHDLMAKALEFMERAEQEGGDKVYNG